jgi:hypothetical protein
MMYSRSPIAPATAVAMAGTVNCGEGAVIESSGLLRHQPDHQAVHFG